MNTAFKTMLAVSAAFLLSSCEDNGPVINDHEVELTPGNDGSLLMCEIKRDLRAATNNLAKMRKTIETVVAEFEPSIASPAITTNNPRIVLLRSSLMFRGEFLDAYCDTRFLDGFADEGLSNLVHDNYFYLPLDTNEFRISHNGELSTLPGITNLPVIVVRWPTTAANIWFRQERMPAQGEPLANLFRAYLDANRTFPWQTNAP